MGIGNDTFTEINDLGSFSVIHKPYALKLAAFKKDHWIVDCKAAVSEYDTVVAALNINRNYKVEIVNGFARFNVSADFTESQQKRFQTRGATCIYSSEQFADEKFTTKVWTI